MDEAEKSGRHAAEPGPISQPQNQPSPIEPAQAPRAALDTAWIDTFYKECGREVTLAYTTLNQMKNWAMTIAAAALAAQARV